MRFLLVLLLLATTAAPAGAQTADLFRKSTGGGETGEPGEADFGLPSDWDERAERIDSIVRVNDSVTVVVRGIYRKRTLRNGWVPQRLDVLRDTLYQDTLYQRLFLPPRRRQPDQRRYPAAVTDSTRVIDQRAMSRDSASRTILLPAGSNDEPETPAMPFVLMTMTLAAGLYWGIARLYRRLSFLN